ncbi:neuralized-like protein 4 [Glandiceps talaboti]
MSNLNANCEYHKRCRRFLKNGLKLSESIFRLDTRYDICFCNSCHTARGDRKVYYRGNPPEKYVLPLGWARISLQVQKHKIEGLKADKDWHVAFHGTDPRMVEAILDAGMLLCPGDVILGGQELQQRKGHFDEHCKPSGFDTLQIFASPSIKYVDSRAYATSICWQDGDKVTSTRYDAQVAFQLWIRPGSYKTGPETLGATSRIDPEFDNKSIEWFTKERPAVVLYGLNVKLKHEHDMDIDTTTDKCIIL